MFNLNEIPVTEYTDPWQATYSHRFAELNKRSTKVAYFYEQADNSTFRYRVYNPAQVINNLSSDVSASYFFLKDEHQFDELSACADLLVICRSRYCDKINNLISKFKRKGKTVIFDVDDLVFDTRYAHFIANNNAMHLREQCNWNDWFGYISRIGLTLSMSDRAITTNAYLAEKISNYCNIPTSVLPNFLNQEQENISNKIYQHKLKNNFRGQGKITIGYFSGSPTHARDFDVAEPALRRLLTDRSNIELKMAGFLDRGDLQQSFPAQVSKVPFCDFINLQREIGAVEINIAPLQDNYFTNCKSELKYFEAAVVGTLTVATPTHTFKNAILNGETGYLSKGSEWESTLNHVLDHLEGMPAIIERAHDTALVKYSWRNQLPTILKALGLD